MAFGLLVLASVLAAAWAARRARTRCAYAAALLTFAVFLWCWPPVAWLCAGTLEWRYPTDPAVVDRRAQAIVVLSGYVPPPRPYRPEPLLGRDTYVRLARARWLAARHRELPLLLSGGRLPAEPDAPPLAAVMREALVRCGIDARRIWTETRSRTTHENAVESAKLLRARGIEHVVLVTEALHMPRAAGCFRREGIVVQPAVCGLSAAELPLSRLETWLPHPEAARTLGRVVHEWVGLLYYRLRGWV